MKYRIWRLGVPVLVLGAAAVLGWVVMMLWNAVVPTVFVVGRVIDYWHALGLLVLSRILFGGFRGRGGWRGPITIAPSASSNSATAKRCTSTPWARSPG